MTASEKNLYDFYDALSTTASVKKISEVRFSMITENFSGWPQIIYNSNIVQDLLVAFESAGIISKTGFPIAVINRNVVNNEATDYFRKISVFPVELWELMEIQQPIFPEYVLAPDSEIQKINSSGELKEFADLVNLHLMGTLKINDSLLYELSAMDGFDFFGLRHEGELVSTLLTYSAYGISGLYFIATQTEHRGKGYAGNLIRYVLNFLFNQGKEKVVLQSDRKAVPLYLRAGFIPVGQMVVLKKI
jgi:predicted GNAT family N-acyltransferase